MPAWIKTLERAFVSGSVASLTSAAALALLARSEGKGALQPLNSTNHWLHGSQAADVEVADLAHTAVGYATHHAATASGHYCLKNGWSGEPHATQRGWCETRC